MARKSKGQVSYLFARSKYKKAKIGSPGEKKAFSSMNRAANRLSVPDLLGAKSKARRV